MVRAVSSSASRRTRRCGPATVAIRGDHLVQVIRFGAGRPARESKMRCPEIYMDGRRSRNKHQTRVLLSESEAAASANRTKAGSDLAPIFFMIEARWFSAVRRLRLRSPPTFLLG
jgi:hypothetical protein